MSNEEFQRLVLEKLLSLDNGQERLFKGQDELFKGQERLSVRMDNVESNMATKEDIKNISNRIENIENNMVTKAEFFQAISEQQKDVKTILQLIDDRTKKLDERIDRLNEKTDNLAQETKYLAIKLVHNEDYISGVKLIK